MLCSVLLRWIWYEELHQRGTGRLGRRWLSLAGEVLDSRRHLLWSDATEPQIWDPGNRRPTYAPKTDA